MWGDSLQHAQISQLLVDNGGLFKSWLPYAPYKTLTVQYGFPLFSALFSWLTGLESVKSTLYVGQIINGMAVLVLYPLAVRFARGNRWAGIFAVLVAGLLSSMPAFYVNWGRFAQMGGQAILPVSLWLIWEVVTIPATITSIRTGQFWTAVIFSAITLSGMTLTYYRMPFFYLSFIVALLVGWGFPHWRLKGRVWSINLGRLASVAIITLILSAPWLPRLVGSNLVGYVEAGIASVSTLDGVLAEYAVWKFIFIYASWILVALGCLGLIWSIFKNAWMIAAQGLWILILSAIIAGRLFHLPGSYMMETFAILISLYIPIGCVIGWMAAEIIGSFYAGWRSTLTTLLLVILALIGGERLSHIAEPSVYAMLTRPDTRAMTWINENIPQDNIRFLIEGFEIYGGTSFVGADAGWWLPVLTGRQNTIPPQYAIFNEQPIQPDYTVRMLGLVKKLSSVKLDSSDAILLLCRENITHVYIGQGQGKVGSGAAQLFSPADLLGSSAFDLLYHQDDVFIFRIKPDKCN
jgi:hypothetical protein